MTFTDFYKQWSVDQPWAGGTVQTMNLAAGSVTFGHIELERLRTSHVQSWVKAMQDKAFRSVRIEPVIAG